MKKISPEILSEIAEKFLTNEVKDIIESTIKASAKDTGEFEVVITTENMDRMGEVISMNAWELDHYMKNPVVLWGHDHRQLPIGICTDIRKEEGKLIAKGKFATHTLAQDIRKLYDLGIVRATSVGFIEKEREGNLITKAELIEFSFVSVPANPFALSTLVKSSLSIDEFITKGILNIETKEISDEAPEEVTDKPTEVPTEDQPTDEVPAEDITDSTDLNEIKSLLLEIKEKLETKEKTVALEETPSEDPERTPEDSDTPSEESEEVKAFLEKRKAVQIAADVIGEVLAEARQYAREKGVKTR